MRARNVQMAAAGQGGPTTYVDDVFSTYLYTGNGTTQTINNGILLGDGPANGTILQLNAETAVDASPIPKALTFNGNVTRSTTSPKYGTRSYYFDGDLDTITFPNLSLVGDFTIECWAKTPNITADLSIMGYGPAGPNVQIFRLNYTSTSNLMAYSGGFIFGNNTSNNNALSGISNNSWFHLAFTRKGGVCRLFVNGVLKETNSSFTAAIPINTVGAGYNGTSEYWNGYLDDIRITDGTALYTDTFTPPTAELPLDTVIPGKGGLVWIKTTTGEFDSGYGHGLWDTARGAGTNDTDASNKVLDTSKGYSAGTTQFGSSDYLSSFSATGFNVVADNDLDPRRANQNNQRYTSWTFRKQPKFFDVVTYTGNGSASRVVSHNLGSVPGMIIIKDLSQDNNWNVYHRSLANTKALYLNGSNASFDSNSWAATTPTSTEFRVSNSGTGDTNAFGSTYVAYIFAHDAGGFGESGADNVISCGVLTAPTSTSTVTSINLGFEPQYILIKEASGVGDWFISDTIRGMTYSTFSFLKANTAQNGNTDGVAQVVPTATGFNVVYDSAFGSPFASGATVIYMAIRRPMKKPTSGTEVFATVARTGTGANATIDSGFPVDMYLMQKRSSVAYQNIADRLRGGGRMSLTYTTDAEQKTTDSSIRGFDSNTQVLLGTDSNEYVNSSGVTYANQMFRRAPGFFDVVCYTGNNASSRTITHNLGVAPELIIVKERNYTGTGWRVYAQPIGNTNTLFLNLTDALATSFNWANTTPTSTVFSVGRSGGAGPNDSTSTYVAYLFATCPGVSKVGSYTGNGSSQTINCGFAGGARFVMIKRTDSTGDWYVWDTSRGIITGNDPYLRINSNAAEVTTNDSVDPVSSGFAVNQLAATNINVTSATYIYLAIA